MDDDRTYQTVLNDIPPDKVDEVIENFEAEGCSVEKTEQYNGNYTVTADCPSPFSQPEPSPQSDTTIEYKKQKSKTAPKEKATKLSSSNQDIVQNYWLFRFKNKDDRETSIRKVDLENSSPLTNIENTRLKVSSLALLSPFDIVYIWQDGEDSGLYGWGRVKGTPFEKPHYRTFPSGEFIITYFPFDSGPLSLKDVTTYPDLENLLKPGQLEGNGYHLTLSQVQALNKLVQDKKGTAPTLKNNPPVVLDSSKEKQYVDLETKKSVGSKTQTPATGNKKKEKLGSKKPGSFKPVNQTGKVTANKLNFRASPSAQGQVIGQLTRGDTVQIIGRKRRWHKIQAGDETGYVFGNYLAIQEELKGLQEYSLDKIDPDYSKDDPYGVDLIDIKTEVEAFAFMVTSWNIDPPLAVAVFGEWGAGKSFFMNKVKEKAIHISEEAKEKERDQYSSSCQHVVHIDFNAWHYVESNLWASLVDHIFVELDKELRKKAKPKEIENLIEELETTQEIKKEAKKNLKNAQEALDQRKAELALFRKKYKRQKEGILNLETADILQWAQKFMVKELEINPEFKGSVEGIKDFLKLEGLEKSPRQLQDIVNQTRTLTRQARYLLDSIIGKPNGWRLLINLVGIVVIIPYAVFLLAHQILELAALKDPTFMAYAEEVLSGIGALFVSGVAWLGSHIKKVASFLTSMSEAKMGLEQILEKTKKEKAQVLSQAESLLINKEGDTRKAEQRFAEAEEEEAKAHKAVVEATSIYQLRSFVSERVNNADYAKHLGIISKIRKDFQRMSDLMSTIRKEKKNEKLTAIMQMNIEEGENGVEKNKGTKPIPYLDRIILYIDDLDRCPPERVVEVLQAIHLFLAFDLFVVFVAVDARWVSRSLQQKYPYLLDEEGMLQQHTTNNSQDAKDRLTRTRGNEASTHDYLEKIFQVPFWVRPMNDTACENLLEGLLNNKSETTSVPEGEDADAEEQEIENKGSKTKENEHEEEKEIEEEGAGDQAQEDEAEEETINSDREKLVLEDQEIESLKNLTPYIGQTPRRAKQFVETYRMFKAGFPTEKSVREKLVIEDQERAFIKTLTPYIGRTPRRIKRFVNTYNIVKAGLPTEFRMEFKEPGFRVVLVLLGLITGAPTLAPKVFKELLNDKDKIKIPPHSFVDQIIVDCPGAEPSERWRARNLLLIGKEDFKNISGSRKPKATDKNSTVNLDDWIRIVRRYSFRSPAE